MEKERTITMQWEHMLSLQNIHDDYSILLFDLVNRAQRQGIGVVDFLKSRKKQKLIVISIDYKRLLKKHGYSDSFIKYIKIGALEIFTLPVDFNLGFNFETHLESLRFQRFLLNVETYILNEVKYFLEKVQNFQNDRRMENE